MSVKRSFLILMVSWFLAAGAAEASVELTPKVAEVLEGQSVLLNCTVNTDVDFCKWTCSAVNSSAYTYNTNGTCSKTGFLEFFFNWTVNCFGKRTFVVTLYNATEAWHNLTLNCSSGQSKSEASKIFVKVPVKFVNLTSPTGSTVSAAEKTGQDFSCETSTGRPAPKITWYKTSAHGISEQIFGNSTSNTSKEGSLEKTVSILSFYPTRNDNTYLIFCRADNVQEVEAVESSRRITLNVTYPPDGPPTIESGQNVSAIIHKSIQLSCSVTGGNPPPALHWNCSGTTYSSIQNSQPNNKTTSELTVTATTKQQISCSCKSSYGPEVTVLINVLFPPEKPQLVLNSVQLPQAASSVDVIVNSSIELRCESEAKPEPVYSWEPVTSGNNQVLSLSNIQVGSQKLYTCKVSNHMSPTSGEPSTGSSEVAIEVKVLYPPVIHQLSDQTLEEGKLLNVTCDISVGVPAESTFNWSRRSDEHVWHSPQLNITQITRNDSTYYSCSVNNTMKPTVGSPQRGEDIKSFFLNVVYQTEIASFTMKDRQGLVEVNENETIRLQCIVESNPPSTISVYNKSEILKSVNRTLMLEYSLGPVTCTDSGIYTCSGRNQFSSIPANRSNALHVTCSPRPSPFVKSEYDVRSALNRAATLQFDSLAYPIPVFTWYREKNSSWVEIEGVELFKVSTKDYQSNLTILNVTENLLGHYNLTAKNSVGAWNQIFYLGAEDIPREPTDFRYLEEKTTETSITLTWKPGFDGGPQQSFILQYSKADALLQWNSINITHHGEDIMNYTIERLSSGTKYDVEIYAENRIGKSTERLRITVSTKDKPSITGNNSAVIGGAVGGGVGCAILTVLAVISIRHLRNKKERETSKTALHKHGRKDEDDTSDEDVVVENAMYVTADAVYAKPGEKKAPDVKCSDVYAAVNKPKTRENLQKTKTEKKTKVKQKLQGDVYENASTTKMFDNAAFEESPYENPTDSKIPVVKKTVTQDGLVYADLAFNKPSKVNKMPVIHGLDEKTEYVQVDFTKRADPLPDSDTEEGKK